MDLYRNILAFYLAGRSGNHPVTTDWVSDCLLHRNTPRQHPRAVGVFDYHSLLGKLADPHGFNEIPAARRRTNEQLSSQYRDHQRTFTDYKHQPRRTSGPVLQLLAVNGSANLCSRGSL